ncbi:MAG: beta-N-acetylhexosaminidase [Gemmatimonadaceae bacterium]|nr:beta-N-acetylhexosaminidase [Gemmatimonadaceae bacterium]
MRSFDLSRAARLSAAVFLVGCASGRANVATRDVPPRLVHAVIPAPLNTEPRGGEPFVVDSMTRVVIETDASEEVARVADMLAGMLYLHPAAATPGSARVVGPRRPEVTRSIAGAPQAANTVALKLVADRSSMPAEGYELDVGPDHVTLVAVDVRGLFHGVQTIRQLLPPAVEHRDAIGRRLWMPPVRIVDAPRFSWRGSMLDVSRHFLGPDDVKRHVDLMALYKLNRLHLHLSDDQGWRIEIRSWPNLAQMGGRMEVGGGVGGFYTQEQFADIVAYARSRFIEVIPEIDMPAHVNAALSAYPELSCDGVAPPPYTGIRVGFSALCSDGAATWRFVDDVVREIAALVPSPWFHIGGDEVEKLTHEQYVRFVERAQGIVQAHGKQMIGWGEIATANLAPSTVVQHWRADSAHVHAARGGKVILSPGPRMYLDMKYDSATVLGLRWAGLIDVRQAYDWEPATFRPGVNETAILGVEAPLWSETLETLADFELMAFPRLAAVAELGWSSPAVRGWEQFRWRLAAHGPRLQALGVNFYRSPQVPWAR